MSAARKLDGRPLVRNPSGSTKLDGAVGIELGRMLELEVGGNVVRAGRDRHSLLWFPVWSALIFFENAKKGSNTAKNLERLEASKSTTRATNAFEKWAQREAEKSYDLTLSAGKRKWYGHGAVKRVDYWSDKWGDDEEYTHDFGRGVKLYILEASRNAAMWVIRGGRLRVTKRGIEG